MGGGKGGGSQTSTTSNMPNPATQQMLNNISNWATQYMTTPYGGSGGSSGPQIAQYPGIYSGGSGGGMSVIPKPVTSNFWNNRATGGEGDTYNPGGTPTGSTMGSYVGTQVPVNNQNSYSNFLKAAQSRLAPLDPSITQAWDQKLAMANDPNSAYNVAAQEALKTLKGDYINANPYLDQIVNRGSDDIMSRVNSSFGLAGRTGSGANQGVLGQSLGDYIANVRNANYQQERGRQYAAMGVAPQLAGLSSDIMGEIGNQRMGYEQQKREAPLNALRQYASLAQPGMGFGTQMTSSPYESNNGALLGSLGYLGATAMIPGVEPTMLGLGMAGGLGNALFK